MLKLLLLLPKAHDSLAVNDVAVLRMYRLSSFFMLLLLLYVRLMKYIMLLHEIVGTLQEYVRVFICNALQNKHMLLHSKFCEMFTMYMEL